MEAPYVYLLFVIFTAGRLYYTQLPDVLALIGILYFIKGNKKGIDIFNCGLDCAKFQAPVGSTLDSVYFILPRREFHQFLK